MTFIKNKYSRIYYSIVEKAKSRVLEEYGEKHHIVPKSLGGSNKKENIVKLTAREHFICHLLLPKMLEGKAKSKMTFALTNFTNRAKHGSTSIYKIGSRTYQIIKENAAKQMSLVQSGRTNRYKGKSRQYSTEIIDAIKNANSKPCVSPNGTVYESTTAAGLAEGVSKQAIQSRIKLQVSGWKYVNSKDQATITSKKKPRKSLKGIPQSQQHITNRVNSRKKNKLTIM